MFTLPISLPKDKSEAYEFTDIPMNIDFLRYNYYFDPWNDDPLYYYSHKTMHKTIDNLNELIMSKRSKTRWLFISHFSYAIMIVGYFVLLIFYFQNNVYVSFIISLGILSTYIHIILCMIYRYTITKQITEVVERQIKKLNIEFKDEDIRFKLINLNLLGFQILHVLPEFIRQESFSLRVIYMYHKLVG